MMYPSNIVHCCFAFLLVSSSSKSNSQENSTNGDEGHDNSTVRYDPFTSFVENQNVEPTLCNSCENFMNNTNKMKDKSNVNSTKNDSKQNNQMSIESYANSTEISYSVLQETNENFTETEGKSNSTSNQFHGNSSKDNYNNTMTIVPYTECKNITCIQLCCPFGYNLTLWGKCVPTEKNYIFHRRKSIFTDVYNSQVQKSFKKLKKQFPLTLHDPCAERNVTRHSEDLSKYRVFANGSLREDLHKLVLPKSYCLALMNFENHYYVVTCTNQTKHKLYRPYKKNNIPKYAIFSKYTISACLLVSLPFLLLTFVVYSILPDLQTIHGYTLCAYVASLLVTYAVMYFDQQNAIELVKWTFCIPLAYIFNFTFLSSFFWLNVTCFDIWWTFSGHRSHLTGRSKDKKKFIIYSLYAWGVSFFINVICIIMDNAGIPVTYIRPEMCRKKFWISENSARMVYFYIPMSFTIITNICFFIATSITLRQNKYRSSQLRASESRRHNENKRRFKMYLKLFIVVGINWVMELPSWFIGFDNELMQKLSLPTKMLNALQGGIIFIIFVCKKKIMKMLLKRFAGWSCGPCCKIPTYDDIVTNTTSTSTSTTQVSMQEIRSPN